MELNEEFWDQKWRNHQTGWDMGHASPPIAEYARQLTNKDLRILIPGCGNAYEAQFLLEQGFHDVTLVDFSDTAVKILQKRFKNQKEIKILRQDFFKLKGNFDLVLEQAFFCAQDPTLRAAYVHQMVQLLRTNGRLVGVLFNKEFEKQGPPFGGTKEEYLKLFSPYFEIEKMEDCYNSIAPRQGNELFINLKKKDNVG